MSKIKTYKKEDIDRIVQNEYLGLQDVDEDKIYNVLMDIDRRELFKDEPFFEILDVMSNPDYFYYTCKHLFNIHLLPLQIVILKELWTKKFPMLIATRGGGKSFLLAVYAMLRAIFNQGSKIIVVGSGFRQGKIIFEYMETLWKGSPILRNLIGTSKGEGPKRDTDRYTFYIGNSTVICIPIGSGEKIRGLRGNFILSDEFAALPQEIFEVVIRGFASVAANPAEKVQQEARKSVMKKLGMYDEDEEERNADFGNQIVISGTAYYSFNHFYDYWKRYKTIIESRGDTDKLKGVFGGEVPEDFDWKQFSIMRIPWYKLPKGFMDTGQVYQAKSQTHKSQALMEYGAVFPTDSNGFFRRSLIEKCVCKEPIETQDGLIQFSPLLRGTPNCEYIYGIDPASEGDNLAIIILEKHKHHRRIVYSWTMNRQKLRERIKKGVEEGDAAGKSFYNYCASKIRSLMRIFPTNHIGIDSQGGGIAIMEALKDESGYNSEKNEQPLWPWIKQGDKDVFWWEKDNKPEDKENGLHILHMINFANADFTAKANHALRKDFESRLCLFPKFDTVAIEEAIAIDKSYNREYDTLEDCTVEIEDLKDELATIVHTQTQFGRDKWDTPETKLPGGRKERQRKDRYSALVIANYIAHVMDNALEGPQYFTAGGFVGRQKGKGTDDNQPMYYGPEHLTRKLPTNLYRGVNRNR